MLTSKLIQLQDLLEAAFSQAQIDMLIGTLLGDGNLKTGSDGATWNYRALHSADFREYLVHKYELLRDYCGTDPIEGSYYDKRTNKTYYRVYFNTLVHDNFKLLADLFYVREDGKWVKHVPSPVTPLGLNIGTLLTAGALAYLHMDDGSIKYKGKSNAMRISTQGFKNPEVELLQLAILNNFGIKTTLDPRKLKNGEVRYMIYVPEESAAKYRDTIKPYLVERMLYKVSNGNYGTLADRS